MTEAGIGRQHAMQMFEPTKPSPQPQSLQPPGQSRWRRILGHALARYIRLVSATSRLTVEPADCTPRALAQSPQIYAMWHGQFLMIPAISPPGAKTDIMVARHGDGDIVSHAMAHFGFGLIRGAGAGKRKRDRGGRAALRGALKSLADGTNVSMTADVPPGPARKAGPGIVTMARLSGRPIVPIAVATNMFFALDTWSRFTINLPFSKMALVMGDPIYVPRDATEAEQEAARQAVETALNGATARAYSACGGDLTSATPPSALPRDAPPPPIGWRLRTYRALSRFLSPLVPMVLDYRARRGKEDPERRDERLGRKPAPHPDRPVVWFHAASVGETNAVLPVIRAVSGARPDHAILLTTGTVTSSQLARERLEGTAIHQFLPVDTPAAVNRFLDHWQPKAAVFVESEIWPNLILALSDRGIPTALINARMSKRSFGRWWRRRGVARQLFARFAVVGAQNESLARRFRALGARTVKPLGNIKNDAPALPVDGQALAALQTEIGSRPVFLAASTHPGEDEIVLDAHEVIATQQPGHLTIIAPRHPHRGDDIANLVRTRGRTVAQRSRGEAVTPGTDVYVADTIGELGLFYRLAPAAFVGGSLVPHGGQNPVEALREQAIVLYGPNTANFADVYGAIAKSDAGLRIETAEDMAAAVVRLAGNDVAARRLIAGGERVLNQLHGALDQTVAEVLALIPDDEDLRRAS